MTTAETFLESARYFNASRGNCLAFIVTASGGLITFGKRRMEIGG